MKRNSKKKGFTLIELIVVIAILGILAVIAVPRLGGFSENAKQASDKQAAAIVANAGAMYVAQHQNDTGFAADDAKDTAKLKAAELIDEKDLALKSKAYGTDPISAGMITVDSTTLKVTVTLKSKTAGIPDYVITK